MRTATMTALVLTLLGVGVMVLSPEALAKDSDNWTRFRGPNGTGVSSATNLPVEFGPQSHVKWKAAVPPGHSSPVFTDSHIFLSAHSPEKDAYKLLVLALDRKSGKQLWQHEIPRLQKGRRENVNGPASPSPVTPCIVLYWKSPPTAVRLRVPPSAAIGPQDVPAHPAATKSMIVAPSTGAGERRSAAHGKAMSSFVNPPDRIVIVAAEAICVPLRKGSSTMTVFQGALLVIRYKGLGGR